MGVRAAKTICAIIAGMSLFVAGAALHGPVTRLARSCAYLLSQPVDPCREQHDCTAAIEGHTTLALGTAEKAEKQSEGRPVSRSNVNEYAEEPAAYDQIPGKVAATGTAVVKRRIRIVGPLFFPDPEQAIVLRTPGPTPDR